MLTREPLPVLLRVLLLLLLLLPPLPCPPIFMSEASLPWLCDDPED
jgi:hypothetical protein